MKDNATVFLQGGSAQTLVMTVVADAKIHIPNQSSDIVINKTDALHIPLTDTSYGYAVINDLLSVPVGLTDTLKSQNITTFQSSASTSNVLDTLTGQHGVTVLVPTDTAFANANATLSRLNTTQLAGVLSSHVLNGTFYSTSLGAAQFNMAGQSLSFNGNSVSLPGGNTAKIVTSDVLTANGVVHVIDTVLLNDRLKASLKKYNASGGIRESKWTAALLSLLLCMCMIAQ